MHPAIANTQAIGNRMIDTVAARMPRVAGTLRASSSAMVSSFFSDLARDLGGAGQLRLIIQPTIAIAFGIRLGISDAHEGREPFGMRVLHARHGRFRLAVSDVIIPLLVAMVVDGALQYYTLRHVRPLASVLVAIVVVWLPFTAARGYTNRFVHAWHGRRATHAP
jgi:hypothetical protein